MQDRIPQPAQHSRHLAAVPDPPVTYRVVRDGQVVSEHASGYDAKQAALKLRGSTGIARSDGARAFTGSRPLLNRAASLRLDQAELFLLSLDGEMLTADAPRASYLLGLAESHLAGMIELVRAVSA